MKIYQPGIIDVAILFIYTLTELIGIGFNCTGVY
jgi:hypothetical protein